MSVITNVGLAIAGREAEIMIGADRTQQAADPRELARAAVEALRDLPDSILLAAGEPYGGAVDRAQGIQIRRGAWNKMLDALLNERSA